MLDGSYTIQVDTPFGTKPGQVELRTEGNTLFADIDAPIIGKQTSQATVDGDTFTAEGSFKVKLVGTITYSLRGEVKDDNLNITIDSSKGHFELKGVRA